MINYDKVDITAIIKYHPELKNTLYCDQAFITDSFFNFKIKQIAKSTGSGEYLVIVALLKQFVSYVLKSNIVDTENKAVFNFVFNDIQTDVKVTSIVVDILNVLVIDHDK